MRSGRIKTMRLWLCIVAVLFLFEPVAAFSDKLPNCIGYLLLCVGLSRVADLNERIHDAYKRIRTMFLVGLGASALQFYVSNVLGGENATARSSEQPMAILLGSFAMLVLQICILLPAVKDLFGGLQALAEGNEGTAILIEHLGRSRAEHIKRATSVFIIAQSVLSVLPELTALTTVEFNQGNISFDWHQYIWMLRTATGVVAWCISLGWLVAVLVFLILLLRDRVWMERLCEKYEREILPNTPMLQMRRYRLSFILLMVGAAFTACLRIGQIDLLPGILCPVLLFIGVLIMRERIKGRTTFFVVAALTVPISILQMLVNHHYLERFDSEEAANYSTEAFSLLKSLAGAKLLEGVMLFLLLCVLLYLIRNLVKTRLAVSYSGAESAEIYSRIATERLQKKLKWQILLTAVLFLPAAFMGMVDLLMRLHYPQFWWIALVLSCVPVVVFIVLLFSVLDELDDRLYSEHSYKKQISAQTVSEAPILKKEYGNHAEPQPEQPESEQPESEQPEPEQPEPEQSESEQSEPEQSESEQSESEQPKSEQSL